MPSIGPLEIGIVLAIALVVFGPKKLPELGRGLGGGMREFKDSVSSEVRELKSGSPAEPLAPEREAGAEKV
ncbi:MAG: twin-arginine translocase TatA/TatE family subunit [Thermoleophilaceae bacterium]|nr:twin-arginine translocase TatA/TatE family subunit [Thermoleophilaceae bacterium]